MARRPETLLRRKVMRALEDLEPWLYHSSPGGSQYIKFKEEGLGSIRIADHRGIPKYRYRWNITIGADPYEQRISDAGRIRHFYNEKELELFYAHIRRYASDLRGGLDYHKEGQ